MSFLLNTNYFVTAPVVTGVTWNPLDKHSSIVLSGGDKIATKTGTTLQTSVRGTVSRSSGKYYLEFVPVRGTAAASVGIGTASATLSNYVGNDANAVGMGVSNGIVRVNVTSIGTGPTHVDGDIVHLAVDLTAELIWFRVNNGNWNANGSADPATGVGGFSFATTVDGGAYFPMATVSVAGNSNTLRASASEFTGTVPSGFSAWDT